ncbi:TetR/AcrR family transcriptional regulator [Achromobacter sp. B7]|uniref:TetR/AcrR family transcriptional regulator n=1 Tax=Achromobacter sp. B7 TaxID=2282475 RepID=UPI000E752EDD|nr:TetR/AcrR family transcriptional regulator [Achromobacter sp. B7]AYD65656.1 TetR/AcrR family transcriptional regulator [Achromobacter sp. B7]
MRTQRQRLPPTVRTGQILDAALQEFSAAGYEGARMEDIALRAGLSKGGLYAHFSSKEQVFRALLERHLTPARLDARAIVEASASVRQLAERLVDHLYASLANPAMIVTMRLLLAESARVPHLARRWRQETADAHLADIASLLALARERGLCEGGVAARHPELLLSPVVHAIVMAILASADEPFDLAARRDAHMALICGLL